MMNRYIAKVTLTILGPILTAGTSPDIYGLDKSFHRDHTGRLTIPASHIKGKLRMALEELAPFVADDMPIDIEDWFGVPSAEGDYTPAPGVLQFSDLVCDLSPLDSKRFRVSVNSISLTANENMLQEVEDPFGSGSEIRWTGSVGYYTKDSQAAQKLVNILQLGFMWLSSIGAQKGISYGRLRFAHVGRPIVQSSDEIDNAPLNDATTLHLRFTPLEPILVGGIKSRRTNYVRTRQEMPGGLIIGALAATLKQAYDIHPRDCEISAVPSSDFGEYETLVTHFSKIRVTHAFPTLANAPRPVRIPISTVQHNGMWYDTALSDASFPLVDGQAPTYFIDWKENANYFGSANPREVFITRSEVDNTSLRTLSGRLFTYSFSCPVDEDGNTVEWVCNVDFSQIENVETRAEVKQEFAKAAKLHLHRLGKLGRRVKVEVRDGLAPTAQKSRLLIEDGIVIITLQSDAVLLDPERVRSLSLGDDLCALYADLWTALSSSSLELVDIFAHQGFEGGYLYHRYLGSAERHVKPSSYRPFYLTRAGSVFRLRVVNEQVARHLVAQWLACGLPLPAWAVAEYGQYDREYWMNCPFVPENGYGEIAVNLAWHWDNKL